MGTSRQTHGMSTKTSLLALVIFLHSSYSLPTPPTGCPVLECTAENNILAFQTQHSYVYKLEASSENLLSGATTPPGGPSGKLHLTATAELQAISPCQFGLSISQVQVVGSDGKKHPGLSGLEGKPVQIGLQNGQLIPELCSDAADDINSLNLKRAVASLLQVASTSRQQTDVFGNCPVEVTESKGGEGVTMFNSHRDLNRCQKRENIISDIPASTYLLNSDTQATPLLKAHAKIQQRVKGGILEAATSHEEYSYRPFSNEGSGALVSVHTSLTLQSQKASVTFKAPVASKVHSVVFEPPHGPGTDHSSADKVINALKRACKTMPNEASADAARSVHQLVQVMRQSTKDDLLTVYGAVKAGAGFVDKDAARKVYLDALLHTSTGEAVEVMAELIKNNAIEEPILFYTRLAFTRHATRASLRAVTGLLDQGNPPRELVLGAGSLAGHYFEQHDHQVEKEIDSLLNRIARPLSNCQPKGHDQENKVLTALKGIHNAHYIPDAVADKIKECATNKKGSARVRSAALDSMQADAANKKLKQAAYDILGDLEEDSELRIKAYLVLATCPCGNVANFVKELLDKEPVNQVGSFIVTHLRNLRASSNPEKIEARKILGKIRTPANKFSLDTRKFSSNAELSYAFGQANAAASAEANVIFSQNSFLPRFTSLNLTTNLFGHSFNLLEVGLRAENLEHILESYFGPKGYFNTHSPNEVLDTGKETVNELAEKIKARASKTIRGRRSVAKADLDKMAAKVQMHGDADNVNLDVYLKLFGAELAFMSYYGDPSSLSPSALVDKVFDAVDNAINKAKNYEYELKQHLVLFDAELVYPTATGFPLRLVASSTAALHLHLAGNFDIHAIVKDPKNAQMRFNIMPSAAIEVAGDIQLDFYAAVAGLKHAATLHTSTGVDVTLKTLNGKGFDLNIGTPLSKQEIITAKSELFVTSKDRGNAPTETTLQFNVQRRDYHGCFDQLSPLIGLTFCGDLGFPFEGVPKKGPFFPLDGPAKVVVRVEKDDTSLTGYHVKALYNDDSDDERSLELTFSTPNSKVDRTVSFKVEAKRKPDYEVKLSVISPIKSASVSGKLINNAQEHSLTGTLILDNEKFVARLGLQVTGNPQTHAVYKPILEYSASDSTGGSSPNLGDQNYFLDGTITVDRNQEAKQFKYTFSALCLTTPKGKYQTDGFISHKKLELESNYDMDMKFKYDNLAHFVSIKLNGKQGTDTYHTFLEAHSSQYPDLAFAINYDLNHGKGLLENKLKVHHGNDLKSEVNCVSLSQYFKFVGGEGSKDFELTTKNQVSYPALEVKGQFDAEATRKSLHYILEGGLDQHRLASEFSLKFGIPGPEGQQNPKDPGGFELGFKCGAAGQTIVVNAGRQIVTVDTSKLHLEVKLQPKGSSFKVITDLTHRLQQNDLKLKLTSVFTISGLPDTYTLCTGIQSNLQSCEGHVKLTKGSEDFFIIKGEATHAGDPLTGGFELLLKGYLQGTGAFSHSKNKNEGTLKVDLFSPKLDRKVKITGDLKPGDKATASVANLEILLNADKDPSKKITVESNIDLAKDGRTYDTKSTVTVISKKYVLSLKGVTPCRTPTDLGVLYRLDSVLELPSKQKIKVFSDMSQLQPKDGHGVTTNLRLDDGSGAKLNYEGRYSRVAGFTLPTYDVSGKLNLVAPSKKDITLLLSITNRQVEGNHCIDYKFEVGGSALPQPLSTIITAELLDEPKYRLVSNYGDKLSSDISGKFSLKNKLEKSAEMNMHLKSTIEGYEDVKSSFAFQSQQEQDSFKVTSQESLEVNGVRKYNSKLVMNFKREEGHTEGLSEFTLFLGPEETEPRVFTNKIDYRGPSLLRITSETPVTFTGSSTLKQGSTEIGLKLTTERPGDGTNSGKVKIEAHTPVEGFEVIEINIDHKSLKGGKLLHTKVDYVLGQNRHYNIDAELDLSEQSRAVKMTLLRSGQANPILKVSVGYTKASFTELEGELQIVVGETNPRSLAIAGNAKYPGGLDDFILVFTLDSETWKLNKVKVEVTNKPGAKGGRRIHVSAKSAEKTYFEGSTNYQRKEDGRSVIYEGKGNFQVGDESRTSTFRLVTKQLSKDKDPETGFDVKLTGELTGSKGKQSLEIHNVLTDKTMRIYDKYCDQDNKCSLLEISNSLKAYDFSEMHIENKVALDLQKFAGLPAFHIQAKFHRNKMEFEHRVEAQLGKDDTGSKYVYEAFVKQHKAGIHLTLPQRTMAVDAVLTTPEDIGKSRNDPSHSYKLEVTAGLDLVRQPEQKLKLLSTMDKNQGKDSVIYTSDVKITHPALTKDLIIKSKSTYGTGQVIVDSTLTLDLFAKKNQAVVIALKNERIPVNGGYNHTSILTVTSKGQNLDVKVLSHFIATKSEIGFGSFAMMKDEKLGTSESGILLSVTLEDVLLLLKTPSCEMLRLQGECKKTKNEDTKFHFELSVLETLALEGEFIGYRSFKYQAYDKNKPTERLVYAGNMELEKEVEIYAEQVTGGNVARLFKMRVALDSEHFLQVDQAMDAEQLKTSLEKLQQAGKAAGDRLAALVADSSKDATARTKTVMEAFKKSQPNLKPLVERFKQEYKELQDELKTDAAIQDIVDLVKNLVSGIAQAVSKAIESLTVHLDKINTRLQEVATKVSELLAKLSPVLTEAAGKISKSLATAFTTLLEVCTRLTAKLLEVLKENSAEIQKFFTLFADFVKEQSHQLGQLLAEARVYLEEFLKTVLEQIKSLPLIDTLKDRYKELYDTFLTRFEGVFHEIAETLKDILPTPELKELVDSIVKYIDKKLKKEPVDEIAEMEKLFQQLVKAVRALTQLVGTASPPGLEGFNLEGLLKLATTPISLEALSSLPKLLSVRLSLLDLLASDDLPSAGDLLATYSVPRRLDDLFPPHRAFGQISASQHFFTFDGDHFTLKGDCQYLLARDFDDGNFSLAVDLAGGKLRSVSLIDHADAVELRADHTVLLNGQAVELPHHHNDLAMFRTLHGVHLKSRAGVYVTCDLHQELCSFAINGFYFGKTRGLLGTISNEKYDDLALPNGKIATTVQQFANAYKLSESCVNQAPVEHKHTSHKECVQAFSNLPSLSACFRFVDATPFRQACEDTLDEANTPEEKLAAICTASAAYISKCRDTTFLQPSLSPKCAHCSLGGGKSAELGQYAAVKSPQGKADVVFLVEQIAENEEAFTDFLTPFTATLISDLKAKGISDTNFAMIGYGGPGQRWPALFTTNGKFAYDGKRPPQLTFGAKAAETPKIDRHPLVAFLDRAREFTALEFGQTGLGQAFQQVLKFPFRADAAKAVILLRHSPCRKTPLPVSLQTIQMVQAREFFRDRGIVVTFLQPVNIASTAGDKKLTGFDTDNALTYNKQKPVDPSLRSEVDYSADSCAPFINLVRPIVFSMKNFKELSGKAGPRKQFVSTASARLATLLTSTEMTQSCQCRLHEGLHSETRCSVTATKDAPKSGGAKKAAKA